MNLTWIDWGLVVALLALIIGAVIFSKALMRSVSDFLAAGRTGSVPGPLSKQGGSTSTCPTQKPIDC